MHRVQFHQSNTVVSTAGIVGVSSRNASLSARARGAAFMPPTALVKSPEGGLDFMRRLEVVRPVPLPASVHPTQPFVEAVYLFFIIKNGHISEYGWFRMGLVVASVRGTMYTGTSDQ